MVNMIRQHYFSAFLLLFCLPVLTGCPGDRWRFDEEATASTRGDNICFAIPDAEDYQPVNIAINPRGTLPGEEKIIFFPPIRVEKGLLCLSPSFYHFPDKGQFIISYVLQSKSHKDTPRRMVSGVEISRGCIFNIPLTDMEIVRPYSEMKNIDITPVQGNHAGSCEYPYTSDPLN
ncbi:MULTISPECIES: putative T6SS immunity periplasmic lipoprotein [unclassified Leclercia]|uniref:putative T6SS immunity periplasmic lipoprotein n=1 Tax=unclassified Leclercia TaxID=2627398 RepID=UPI001AEF437D|nr:MULTISPECIES: putative T6SS immunity periplasmic lipoprotein [unclassified Leclercia]